MTHCSRHSVGRVSNLVNRSFNKSRCIHFHHHHRSPRRTFFGIDAEKIRQSDARRAAAKEARSAKLREEMRSLPVRQMQILMSDKKPASVATPLRLTPIKESPDALPKSADGFPCIDVNDKPVNLAKVLLGKNKLTLLHISFSGHSFELGQTWLDSAKQSWQHIQTEDPAFTKIKFQCYSLSLVKQSWLRNWFGPSTVKALKVTIDNEDKEPFTLSLLSTPHVQLLQAYPVLALTSQELLGYVLLIDGQGKLRWRAWGQMEPSEATITQHMIKRLAAQQGNIKIKDDNIYDLLGIEQPAEPATSVTQSATKLNPQTANKSSSHTATPQPATTTQ